MAAAAPVALILAEELNDPGVRAAPPGSYLNLTDSPSRVPHVGRMFAQVAARHAESPALSTRTSTWTYAALLRAARRVSQSLATNCEFRSGDRVALLLPNSVEYLAAFFGVLLAGGVVVPLSPRTESGTLQGVLDSTEAVAVVTDPNIARSRADLQNLTRIALSLCEPALERASVDGAGTHLTGDVLAAIFFTGGTTGSTRGVMLSHRNLISNARSISQYLRITSAERPLCVLPFHHAFGNSVLQSHLLRGAHAILDGQGSFPDTLIDALARHACTSLSGVPDLFRILLERSSLGRTRLPALRYMAVAGGALPHDLTLEIAGRIAPADFFVMYGQTEATARLAYLAPQLLGTRSTSSIGRAIPGVTLEIVDERGRSVVPGEIGELRARGDNVMLGYWRDPQATAERLRGEWLYTGDLAARDDSGLIALHGRLNSIVKIAGFRVQPAELEEFAVRRLGVAQAVAVPFEAGTVGTRLALYARPVSSPHELTLSGMIARCRAELPRHLVPELIQIVDQLPLNQALKIDRPLLTRLAEQAHCGKRDLPA